MTDLEDEHFVPQLDLVVFRVILFRTTSRAVFRWCTHVARQSRREATPVAACSVHYSELYNSTSKSRTFVRANTVQAHAASAAAAAAAAVCDRHGDALLM